jgi:hypothetical protein
MFGNYGHSGSGGGSVVTSPIPPENDQSSVIWVDSSDNTQYKIKAYDQAKQQWIEIASAAVSTTQEVFTYATKAELPAIGNPNNCIYIVRKDETQHDGHSVYIWDNETSSYELIQSSVIDLGQY